MFLVYYAYINMAKRAGRVEFRSGQLGWRVKQVADQNRSFLSESIGLRVWLSLPIFFKKVFFFYQLQKQINDNMFRGNE